MPCGCVDEVIAEVCIEQIAIISLVCFIGSLCCFDRELQLIIPDIVFYELSNGFVGCACFQLV